MGKWTLLISTLMCASLGQIFLKYGVLKVGGVRLSENFMTEVVKIIGSPYIVSGFVCYGLSSYLTLVCLTRFPLSFFAPFMASTFVIVLFASHFIFDEQISFYRLIGFALIILGVVFVGK